MSTVGQPKTEFKCFKQFYPYYLQEHANRVCRRLHIIGTALVIGLLLVALLARQPLVLLLVPLAGYGFAWIGHFFFEHNKPATFKYPLYSLMGDFVMFRDALMRRISW